MQKTIRPELKEIFAHDGLPLQERIYRLTALLEDPNQPRQNLFGVLSEFYDIGGADLGKRILDLSDRISGRRIILPYDDNGRVTFDEEKLHHLRNLPLERAVLNPELGLQEPEVIAAMKVYSRIEDYSDKLSRNREMLADRIAERQTNDDRIQRLAQAIKRPFVYDAAKFGDNPAMKGSQERVYNSQVEQKRVELGDLQKKQRQNDTEISRLEEALDPLTVRKKIAELVDSPADYVDLNNSSGLFQRRATQIVRKDILYQSILDDPVDPAEMRATGYRSRFFGKRYVATAAALALAAGISLVSLLSPERISSSTVGTYSNASLKGIVIPQPAAKQNDAYIQQFMRQINEDINHRLSSIIDTLNYNMSAVWGNELKKGDFFETKKYGRLSFESVDWSTGLVYFTRENGNPFRVLLKEIGGQSSYCMALEKPTPDGFNHYTWIMTTPTQQIAFTEIREDRTTIKLSEELKGAIRHHLMDPIVVYTPDAAGNYSNARFAGIDETLEIPYSALFNPNREFCQISFQGRLRPEFCPPGIPPSTVLKVDYDIKRATVGRFVPDAK